MQGTDFSSSCVGNPAHISWIWFKNLQLEICIVSCTKHGSSSFTVYSFCLHSIQKKEWLTENFYFKINFDSFKYSVNDSLLLLWCLYIHWSPSRWTKPSKHHGFIKIFRISSPNIKETLHSCKHGQKSSECPRKSRQQFYVTHRWVFLKFLEYNFWGEDCIETAKHWFKSVGCRDPGTTGRQREWVGIFHWAESNF